jgi:hypothetical protein
MTRIAISFHSEDISALARFLRRQWQERETPPSHLDLLNMLARGIGYRNFQHLRAQPRDASVATVGKLTQHQPTEKPVEDLPPADLRRIERVLRHFDAGGSLTRWPGRWAERELILWVLWSRLPARRTFAEREINDRLTAMHGFGDYALLRRTLVDYRLIDRTRDGRVYRRLEQPLPAGAGHLIRLLGARSTETQHQAT